jgi:hypothetical protein
MIEYFIILFIILILILILILYYYIKYTPIDKFYLNSDKSFRKFSKEFEKKLKNL